MSQEGNQADGSHANSVGEQSPESLKKESGEGEETGCEVEAEGKSEEQQEVEQQDRIYLFQWPDATITIARAKDETELKRQMQLLGSVENCRLTEYKGPLQINLKLAPIPGVWKDDPQFLEFVHKVDDKKKLVPIIDYHLPECYTSASLAKLFCYFQHPYSFIFVEHFFNI